MRELLWRIVNAIGFGIYLLITFATVLWKKLKGAISK